jgi:toxin ParE1/3/4
MKGYILSRKAVADLNGIWDYTAERWNIEQAERYTRAIKDACTALVDERAAGRPMPEIRDGYYKFAVGSHFLIYRITDAGFIHIIRILHQKMDIPERLQ